MKTPRQATLPSIILLIVFSGMGWLEAHNGFARSSDAAVSDEPEADVNAQRFFYFASALPKDMRFGTRSHSAACCAGVDSPSVYFRYQVEVSVVTLSSFADDVVARVQTRAQGHLLPLGFTAAVTLDTLDQEGEKYRTIYIWVVWERTEKRLWEIVRDTDTSRDLRSGNEVVINDTIWDGVTELMRVQYSLTPRIKD